MLAERFAAAIALGNPPKLERSILMSISALQEWSNHRIFVWSCYRLYLEWSYFGRFYS
jgi:hypothetical protein